MVSVSSVLGEFCQFWVNNPGDVNVTLLTCSTYVDFEWVFTK